MIGRTNRLAPFAFRSACAVIFLLSALAGAEAASRLCRQLEADLASASGGSSSQTRRYDRAIAKQRDAIRQTRDRLRGENCGFSLFGGGRCGQLNDAIDRMEANLASLEDQRAGMRSGGSRSELNRILAALNANGCREEAAPKRQLPDPIEVNRHNAEVLKNILETGLADELDDDIYGDGERVSRVLNGSNLQFYGDDRNTYRTLCVRSCDGYYFPISVSSSRADFDRDQKNCEASCPGSEVTVYYHRADGEESGDMVSAASGAPYSALPSAYLYKKTDAPTPAACTCQAARPNFTVIAGRSQPEKPPAAEPFLPRPVNRPDPATDPETLANAEGGLTAEALSRMAARQALPPPSPAGERKIRVVGPSFLPDQEAATGLQAPDRTEVR